MHFGFVAVAMVGKELRTLLQTMNVFVLPLICKKQGGALRNNFSYIVGFGVLLPFFSPFQRVAGTAGSGSTVQTLSKCASLQRWF